MTEEEKREAREKLEVEIENETSITDGWTDCCGYDFGLDAFDKILKVQYCPICGRRITRIN